MRLKSLDVVGFKSFLEPTVISFSPGITAVVGPNGCGKSNVVDAIRWVLGEQAPTRLRGKSAEDLIYAGNESNQPAGLAEVTLLLEADDVVLPEPYATLSEVAVTRRVYRSGEAEYLLNRIPCRLKDITEFFMAAQIHSRGYALVEQGRIDEIIQAKPHELRAMVEEAAGLALFKGRRELSERKLERVRENLTRVDDVVAEIERQLNFARRQAKKAEAYKVIRAELGELEQLTAARRILDEQAELNAQSARAEQLDDQAIAARAAFEAARQAAEEAGAALAAARGALVATERELTNLQRAFEERARSRGFLERRLASLRELTPQIIARLSELEAQATTARACRAETGARLARARLAPDGDGEERLKPLGEAHRAAEARLRAGERRVEELKDQLSEMLREAAVTRGRLGDLAGERADTVQRLAAMAGELPALANAVNDARASLHQAESAKRESHARVARSENLQGDSAERAFQLRAALEQARLKLAAAVDARDRAGVNARRIVPNGAGERLRGVLDSLNGDGPAIPPAMLLDVMKAPPALEPALRAVLGEQLDAVIVDSPHFALRAIEVLKERDSGRLSFISQAMQVVSGVHETIHAPGIAGRLLEMVEVEPRFAPLAEALMGHVLVAQDLRAALAASNLNGHGAIFVTPEGDMLWPDRMISGGSGGRRDDAGEIDMRQRAAALEAGERAVAVAASDYEELQRRADWARITVRDELTELERGRAEVIASERATETARAALAKAEQQMALAEANRAAGERRVDEAAKLAVAANVRLEELARGEQELRARLGDAADDLSETRSAARRLGDELIEFGARIAARKAALKAFVLELSHRQSTAAGLESQIRRDREELERVGAECAEFERELAMLAEQDAGAAARRIELAAALEELTERQRDCETRLAAARTELALTEERANALAAELIQCQLDREHARTLAAELERGFGEKFPAAFAAVVDELRPRLADGDPHREEERLSELRARAERIGEVNLAADSEVRELEERAASLGAERADLQQAADDLAQTVQKLNREARKRFAETFEGAAKNFAELFPKLMRGGRGHLELCAADDVLDAGVNILVQPAGKRVKEIGLLSGGEKALSAMALIFALFLLNPSPFCIMDEVDAPLDEFSLAAFTALVQELKSRSQFIIVTHNQRTMQAADQIHGVTMERPGISRVLSLSIPQAA
ncbi:MAG TPA: chromosome segregation protein SMC [Candidatus Binataceae bacterium]|nr:chromosome segregation protein SMC [Candidatus Binataceae bacterium]